MKKNLIAELSAVRGLAACGVFFDHYLATVVDRFFGTNNFAEYFLASIGYYSVFVFFLLSGFLISNSVDINVTKNGKIDYRKYFFSRIARLYPPLFASIVVSVAVYTIMYLFDMPGINRAMRLPGDIHPLREIVTLRPREILQSLMMKQGMLSINGPLWSLYIEAKIYVIYACLIGIVTKSHLLKSIAGLIIFIALSLIDHAQFVQYFALWLAGSCTFQFYKYGLKIKNYYLFAVLLSLILATVAGDLFGFYQNSAPPFPNSVAHSSMMWDLFKAVCSFYLLLSISRLTKIGYDVSAYSYTLYLVHFPILILFQSFTIQAGIVSPTINLIIIIFAAITALLLAKSIGIIELYKQAITEAMLKLV